MKNMPMDNNEEIEPVLTRSREGRENNAAAAQLNVEELSNIVVDAAFHLHCDLGPGPLGLLINFGAATFKEGVKRIANNHHDFASSRLRVNHDRNEKTT